VEGTVTVGPKKKIAILGGGVSAVTVAMELTNDEKWEDRFESITLYQMGWRLGGNGATGRGPDESIEEHGLHVWLGYYENAFRLIQDVYAAAKRPKGSHLASWREAFAPQDFVGVNQLFEGKWQPWMFDFPRNDGTPGEGGEFPTLFEYLEMIVGWIARLHEPTGLLGRLAWIMREAGAVLGLVGEETIHTLSKELRVHASKVRHREHHPFLIDLLKRVSRHTESALTGEGEHSLEAQRVLLLMNMGATIVSGLLVDQVCSFEELEQKLEAEDFSSWLKRHNSLPLVWDLRSNPLLRGMYDFAFAYENGDVARPNFAAAPALRTIFRMCLTYKGSIFYKMKAGMGDTIFAPAYQALRNRGVNVQFFHKVTSLGVSADKQSIATLKVEIQATTRNGAEYRPLVDVTSTAGSLPCWPNHPLYEQLREGEMLETQNIDLESFWTPWKGPEIRLEAGKDFDVLVFGISLGSVPFLCAELVAESEPWQRMVEAVATVRTQSAQLWLKPDIHELGWTRRSPMLVSWIEPLNTWADMTTLLNEEGWSGSEQPGSLAYFVGPMKGGIPDSSEKNFPKAAKEEVSAAVQKMLADHVATLWPRLGEPGLPKSDQVLSYCRANIDPSERYVLSLANSARYRLKANGAGFANLVLTGDWIDNGYNAGCVEAAVWSGIQAANAILGRPLNHGVISESAQPMASQQGPK
jgi:uncharacterized protein with NAD-binding domain and iron-sulfur cluster